MTCDASFTPPSRVELAECSWRSRPPRPSDPLNRQQLLATLTASLARRGQAPANDLDPCLVVGAAVGGAGHERAVFQFERVAEAAALRHPPGRLALDDELIVRQIPGVAVVVA